MGKSVEKRIRERVTKTKRSGLGKMVRTRRVGLVQTDLGRDIGHTHTTHTHTIYSLTDVHPYIYTFLCVSHTNTFELLLNSVDKVLLIRGLC